MTMRGFRGAATDARMRAYSAESERGFHVIVNSLGVPAAEDTDMRGWTEDTPQRNMGLAVALGYGRVAPTGLPGP